MADCILIGVGRSGPMNLLRCMRPHTSAHDNSEPALQTAAFVFKRLKLSAAVS
jgi:hypothetical protein